jgi:hypothetical protein
VIVFAAMCVLFAAPAHAATKPYFVAFSALSAPQGVSIPNAMPAGMTIAGFTVTLRNDTTTQMMGSAEVTVPFGYVVASKPTASRGTVQGPNTKNELILRDLDVAPGESVAVTFDLQLPCVSKPSAWVVVAKQSNDFNGTGNLLTPPPDSTLVTTVSSACALRFVAGSQPAGAGKNQRITSVDYRSDEGNPVAVEAVDGRAKPSRSARSRSPATSGWRSRSRRFPTSWSRHRAS